MSRLILFFLVSVSFFPFASCTSNENGNSKDVNPESIYFDYRVWGDEDAGYMTVRLQYRSAGRNGTTKLLKDPARAELDGEQIKADSSKMSGAYYEVTKPVKDFTGQHNITFTNLNGKEYKEEFNFQPLFLKTRLPKIIHRDDLSFDLDGLAPRDYIHVMVSDTATFSEGIIRTDTVIDGHIIISRKDLSGLINGPIQLTFSKEDEKRIKNGTKEGGKLSISYELKREFMLTD